MILVASQNLFTFAAGAWVDHYCDKLRHFDCYKGSISLFHVKNVVEPRRCPTAFHTRENREHLHHTVILCEIYLKKNRLSPFMKQ